jgi:hypothetical protein
MLYVVCIQLYIRFQPDAVHAVRLPSLKKAIVDPDNNHNQSAPGGVQLSTIAHTILYSPCATQNGSV